MFTALLVGICVILPFLFPGSVLFIAKFWIVFGFIAGITLIAMIVALAGIKRNPETGVMAIMGSITVKLLFTMAFVLIYVLKTPVNSLLFVINFFSLYFLFSGFELYCLLRNLRHPIKK
ncbi:MAG: hypothetical protein EOP53_19960 [Sphingobacteriales bacterium]|nr:MAG: hypothetical protein EOP53_19960 [Sphingobacteriales bacterium]